MASPGAIIEGLAGAFPELDEFARILRQSPSSFDIERETSRQTDLWNAYVNPPPRGVGQVPPAAPERNEFTLKVRGKGAAASAVAGRTLGEPLHSSRQ
jgi:hypothetical protein